MERRNNTTTLGSFLQEFELNEDLGNLKISSDPKYLFVIKQALQKRLVTNISPKQKVTEIKGNQVSNFYRDVSNGQKKYGLIGLIYVNTPTGLHFLVGSQTNKDLTGASTPINYLSITKNDKNEDEVELIKREKFGVKLYDYTIGKIKDKLGLNKDSEYKGFIVYRDEDRQDLMNQRAINSRQEDPGARMEEIRKIAAILADVKRNKFPDIDKFTQKDVDEIYKLAKKNKGYGEFFSIKFGEYIYKFLQTWKPGQRYDDMIAQGEKYKYSAGKLEFIERFELQWDGNKAEFHRW